MIDEGGIAALVRFGRLACAWHGSRGSVKLPGYFRRATPARALSSAEL